MRALGDERSLDRLASLWVPITQPGAEPAQLLFTRSSGRWPDPGVGAAAARGATTAPEAAAIFPSRIFSDLNAFREVQQQTRALAVSYCHAGETPVTPVQGSVGAFDSEFWTRAKQSQELNISF